MKLNLIPLPQHSLFCKKKHVATVRKLYLYRGSRFACKAFACRLSLAVCYIFGKPVGNSPCHGRPDGVGSAEAKCGEYWNGTERRPRPACLQRGLASTDVRLPISTVLLALYPRTTGTKPPTPVSPVNKTADLNRITAYIYHSAEAIAGKVW